MSKLEPLYIKEETVHRVLNWPMVNEATKEALSAVSNHSNDSRDLPIANQPPRTHTWNPDKKSILLSMPCFVGEYTISNKKFNGLGCKLVTAFSNNSRLPNPLPNILANILLFDSCTGQLRCIMEATEITAWRTAAASICATKYLYYARLERKPSEGSVLAILGCGVEGRAHAIGMCSTFDISEIRLWNRTESKSIYLKNELDRLKDTFRNRNLIVRVLDTAQECALNSDIIVTATFSSKPLLYFEALKADVHINAVGAGLNHYSELDSEIYLKAQVYVDHMAGAKIELEGLNATIIGEVGEVINGDKVPPKTGISVFQSLGMAAEDVIVAQAVFEAVKNDGADKIQII